MTKQRTEPLDMTQAIEIDLPTYQDILDDNASPPPAYSCLVLPEIEEEIDLPSYQDFLDDLVPPPDYSDVFPEKQRQNILKKLWGILEVIAFFIGLIVTMFLSVFLLVAAISILWFLLRTISHA